MLEFRAMTNRFRNRDKAVIISSTIPSAKYSCAASSLKFWKGSTAMAGFTEPTASGSGSGDGPGGSVVSDSVTFASPTVDRIAARFSWIDL
jgi:hypothetical protein